MAEPEHDAGVVYEGEETVCGFVVAGCQPAAAFEFVEAALDHVAHGVVALDVFPNFIRVIAPIGDQNCWLRQVVGHHQIIAGVVGILRRCDLGPHREASTVDAEVDLGREPTSRTANSFLRSPPFAPAA